MSTGWISACSLPEPREGELNDYVTTTTSMSALGETTITAEVGHCCRGGIKRGVGARGRLWSLSHLQALYELPFTAIEATKRLLTYTLYFDTTETRTH